MPEQAFADGVSFHAVGARMGQQAGARRALQCAADGDADDAAVDGGEQPCQQPKAARMDKGFDGLAEQPVIVGEVRQVVQHDFGADQARPGAVTALRQPARGAQRLADGDRPALRCAPRPGLIRRRGLLGAVGAEILPEMQALAEIGVLHPRLLR